MILDNHYDKTIFALTMRPKLSRRIVTGLSDIPAPKIRTDPCWHWNDLSRFKNYIYRRCLTENAKIEQLQLQSISYQTWFPYRLFETFAQTLQLFSLVFHLSLHQSWKHNLFRLSGWKTALLWFYHISWIHYLFTSTFFMSMKVILIMMTMVSSGDINKIMLWCLYWW